MLAEGPKESCWSGVNRLKGKCVFKHMRVERFKGLAKTPSEVRIGY